MWDPVISSGVAVELEGFLTITVMMCFILRMKNYK